MPDAVLVQQAAVSAPLPIRFRRRHKSSGLVHTGQSHTYGGFGVHTMSRQGSSQDRKSIKHCRLDPGDLSPDSSHW